MKVLILTLVLLFTVSYAADEKLLTTSSDVTQIGECIQALAGVLGRA